MPLLNSLATPYADALLQVTDSPKRVGRSRSSVQNPSYCLGEFGAAS